MSLRFRSNFEKKVYEAALQEGMELSYEPSEESLKYIVHSRYIPDFVLPNGIIVEVKGRFTAFDRRKMLLVRDNNPGIDIRFLFQRAKNKLNKASQTTYAQWCIKNEFEYAEGTIPLEWWEEVTRGNNNNEDN